MQLTVPEIAAIAAPRAPVLPRLDRVVGLAEPLDLCDLDGGERIVHLRVRAGKSRARIAADLGWHPDTYRAWEPTVPFFHRQLLRPGARVDGTWRPPAYGLMEYGNPSSFFVFEAPPSASTRPSNEPRQTSPRSSKNCYMTDLPYTALSL